MSKSLLFYNLYPKYGWREITAKLFSNVPHDDIIVHVSLPLFGYLYKKWRVAQFLADYSQVKQVIFSLNKPKLGEVVGLIKLQQLPELADYNILSYIHSKGSSKKRKNTIPIKDWTELMRYFVVERLDLAKQAFSKGYWFYGANLSQKMHPKELDKIQHPDTLFIYEGNFITVNLVVLRDKIQEVQPVENYYGVERFWGRLGPMEKAYSAHKSTVNQYNSAYPPSNYR